MSILLTILGGAIIGWLAGVVGRTRDQIGCLWNILIGMVGAAAGYWLADLSGSVSYSAFSIRGFLFGLCGAILLLLLLRVLGVPPRSR